MLLEQLCLGLKVIRLYDDELVCDAVRDTDESDSMPPFDNVSWWLVLMLIPIIDQPHMVALAFGIAVFCCCFAKAGSSSMSSSSVSSQQHHGQEELLAWLLLDDRHESTR